MVDTNDEPFVLLTLQEFRDRNHLSQATWKKLRRLGLGPDIIPHAGGRVTLTAEAAWRRKFEKTASPTVNLKPPRAKSNVKQRRATKENVHVPA